MQIFRFIKSIFMLFIILGLFFTSAVSAQDDKKAESFSLREKSSFIKDIDDKEYDEISPPDNPILFRWDFSENKVYSYDFNQRIVSQSLMNGLGSTKENNVATQNMTGNGNLSYKSERDKTARFVLENLTVKSEISTRAADSEPKMTEMKSPPMIIQGVKEDGNLSIPSSSQTLLLKLLFPLPEKPMKLSETIDVEANMPFNAMGSLLHVKGYAKITLSKFVMINGHRCAKILSNIDISKIDVPPELEGKYIAFAKGKSVFYFDIDNRKFIGGKLALLMTMDIEAKSPQVDFKGDNEKSQELPETIKMAMNNDSLISLSIID